MRALEAEMQAAVADGRAGAGLALRVRLAVLALMRSPRRGGDGRRRNGRRCCGVEAAPCWPSRAPRAPDHGRAETALPRRLRDLPAGAVARLVGPAATRACAPTSTDAELLHAEAAPLVVRDALVRCRSGAARPALLALGARETGGPAGAAGGADAGLPRPRGRRGAGAVSRPARPPTMTLRRRPAPRCLDWLARERRASANTVEAYGRDLALSSAS